jgi:acetylornithine deacetylase/succinyl-diaminopimelate desuccinylase-like protein
MQNQTTPPVSMVPFQILSLRAIIQKLVVLCLICIAGAACATEGPNQPMASLMAQPVVAGALSDIEGMQTELLDDLIELTEIPAPPFGEQDRAERFAEKLREAGLTDVSIDSEGNVIGRRPGRKGKRSIALTAHLDTVFPAETDVRVRIEGDTLYAPGIGDNTRGLVSVLAILRSMQANDMETEADVLFIGNVGEEGLGDLRGVKHLFRDGGPSIDAMIAIDGGKTNRLVYGGVGSHRYRITFKGPGGHSWGAFGRANPHHALGRAIALFANDAIQITQEGEKTTFNVGRIGGGTSVNSIPFESWMEIDMRSGSQLKLDDIDAALRNAVLQTMQDENAARQEGLELTVDIERIGTRPTAHSDVNATLVEYASAAMRALGIEPDLRISSTDANYPISIGVPAVTLSRGGVGENTHSPAESWTNSDAHLANQVALLTLLVEAGISEGD